jgi:hypothetical protein
MNNIGRYLDPGGPLVSAGGVRIAPENETPNAVNFNDTYTRAPNGVSYSRHLRSLRDDRGYMALKPGGSSAHCPWWMDQAHKQNKSGGQLNVANLVVNICSGTMLDMLELRFQ